MKFLVGLAAVVLAASTPAFAAPAAQADAARRVVLPDTVRPERYDIRVRPNAQDLTFTGHESIAVTVVKPTDRIVLYNTGSGLKYPEAYSTRFPRAASGEQDKLGGLITPR